jgi:hypothetical protein
MARIPINIVGQSYEMPAKQLNAQTCINWYLTFDRTGKFQKALLPVPGLEVFAADSTHNEVRGLFQLNDILYAVIDNTFYIVDNNGNKLSKGTLNTSTGVVIMIPNENQILITDKYYGYIYQLVTTSSRDAGDFFEITEATSFIGNAVFEGSGLDDMSSGGTYTGSTDKEYVIEIDSAGTGVTPDTFRWSDSGGTTYNATGVSITASDQTLNDGVTVSFLHTQAHTLNDKWSFSVTTDSEFYVPLIPAYQDGYGIYVKQNTNRWYISGINDFSVVNALDYATANAFPDDIQAAISIREELWLIGRQTTEVWYDTGAAEFPFERRTGLIVKYGCDAPLSVAVADNNFLLWLARNEEGARVVVMIDGYEAKIISNEAINAAMNGYDKVDNAFSFVHQWDGHIFFVITFPSADRTWVYDLTTQAWHERRSELDNELPYVTETRQGRWRPSCYSYYKGKHLVGDFESGNIFKLSRSTYDENGTSITRERTSQVTQSKLDRITINSLQIDFEAGKGLNTGQGSDPQIMLEVSRDGGYTWGNELWRSSGKVGEYTHRAKWNRLGTARSFVFRIRSTDPIYNVVLGAVADVEDTGE